MRPHIHTNTRVRTHKQTININTYVFNLLMRSAILIAFCRLILICIEIHSAPVTYAVHEVKLVSFSFYCFFFCFFIMLLMCMSPRSLWYRNEKSKANQNANEAIDNEIGLYECREAATQTKSNQARPFSFLPNKSTQQAIVRTIVTMRQWFEATIECNVRCILMKWSSRTNFALLDMQMCALQFFLRMFHAELDNHIEMIWASGCGAGKLWILTYASGQIML